MRAGRVNRRGGEREDNEISEQREKEGKAGRTELGMGGWPAMAE